MGESSQRWYATRRCLYILQHSRDAKHADGNSAGTLCPLPAPTHPQLPNPPATLHPPRPQIKLLKILAVLGQGDKPASENM